MACCPICPAGQANRYGLHKSWVLSSETVLIFNITCRNNGEIFVCLQSGRQEYGRRMETNNVIYIKNMVCDRCVMAVTDLLKRLGFHPQSVVLGKAELAETPTEEERKAIGNALQSIGFELIEDPRHRLAEQIKQLIIGLVHKQGHRLRTNLSQYLSEQCRHDYSALSKLFSEVQGTTIEKYFIAQKIERVKELLDYGELTLNEIADSLDYSSTAHLCTQFKSLTGLTPKQYKQQEGGRRRPLDKI